MIQLIRVDDRLLHGQVGVSWKAHFNYEAIVIASDIAYKDPLRVTALKMAKPDGVLIAIRDIQEAIKLLHNSKLENLRIFVVTDTVANAKTIYEAIDEKPLINIGGLQKAENKKALVSYAYFSEKEIELLHKMNNQGIDVEFKLVPSDKEISLKDLLKS